MRYFRNHILFLTFLMISVVVPAQFDPSAISRVENGRINFMLDVRWTETQKKEVQSLFSLDSTLWEKINGNTSTILLDSIVWNLKQISQFVVELSKNIDNIPAFHFNENDIFLVGEAWQMAPGYVDQDKVIYGINRFKKNQYFQYNKGQARFYIPGYQHSKHVNIAGSFNSWDPSLTAMQRVDSGWVVSLPLPEGKYLYKFILDGNWMEDPNNNLSENDGQGNKNSVIFCTNVFFHLKGYSGARKVTLTGTFNNWNRKELRMQPSQEGWFLPMYLKDGTYSYKFIVDDEWITDPSNSKFRTDAKGNRNSVIGKGEEYLFRLPGNISVGMLLLTGSFNNWNPDELVMDKTENGWKLSFQLASGNYEYKFIADGRWMPDPFNPYTTGSGDFVNSCLAFKPNHTFLIDAFPDAKEVKISGSFNNWNPEGYKMVKKEGKWTFPVYLSKGKHLYKLIVDGEWLTDPTNRLWDDNEYGTGNSVLWIMD